MSHMKSKRPNGAMGKLVHGAISHPSLRDKEQCKACQQSTPMGRWEVGFTSQDLTYPCETRSNAGHMLAEHPNGAMGSWFNGQDLTSSCKTKSNTRGVSRASQRGDGVVTHLCGTYILSLAKASATIARTIQDKRVSRVSHRGVGVVSSWMGAHSALRKRGWVQE